MTSGVKTVSFDTWRVGWIGLLLACMAPGAWAFDLGELMGLLSNNRSGQARFVEQRFVQGLDQPLESRGTLSFVAPDRFTRTTLSPRSESMAVEGNAVLLQRGSRSRSMALDASPEVAAIVEAVRGTLSGDGQALQRHFKPQLGGDMAGWDLLLVPRDVRLAGQVSHIRIGGRRNEVRSVEVQLADGDRSLMRIEPVALATGAASAPGAASQPAP